MVNQVYTFLRKKPDLDVLAHKNKSLTYLYADDKLFWFKS